ncbi:DUF1361 domain-containing protein [Janibacter melonis]|uniref:DUF1361 domain-containing protein n=1 Tax=Janibacter melonis TaxID=262209 RepID=UPI001E54FB68|nr:DUF1361 domain-containing protein [Janibacter melonis]MCB5992174.1 DUF1361 domain-containing protein [Janibacter melonis]
MSGLTSTPARTRPATRWVAVATTLLVLGSLAACGLVALRADRVGEGSGLVFGFLAWNLFLAWVPYVLALLIGTLDRDGRPGWLLLGVGVVWLAFLPNAPYILTDFIHLGAVAGVPLWFDAALIASFAGTGLALGLVSLVLVHRVVARRLGPAAGWVSAVLVLALSAVGVYLGRFPRFNSWDVVTNPGGLVSVVLSRASDPLGNPFLLQFVLGLSVLLLVSYVLTWMLAAGLLGPARRTAVPPSRTPARGPLRAD